ncbi:hypothetical protein NPIL_387541 [Nephila pilipes]|uniref:Tc1-like transposase DDE domain-containing protein n=1 Tax=Nephila pilipes TaxID=299642 RepID=A0A8X6N3T8_NEPPI|nr:hypothetical protein NPIL_387541 [Nephila pilipes]
MELVTDHRMFMKFIITNEVVVMWVGFMFYGRTSLHIFDASTATLQCYCINTLLDLIHHFRGEVGPEFLFLNHNAQLHRTVEVSENLESKKFESLELPAVFDRFKQICLGFSVLMCFSKESSSSHCARV